MVLYFKGIVPVVNGGSLGGRRFVDLGLRPGFSPGVNTWPPHRLGAWQEVAPYSSRRHLPRVSEGGSVDRCGDRAISFDRAMEG